MLGFNAIMSKQWVIVIMNNAHDCQNRQNNRIINKFARLAKISNTNFAIFAV